MLMQKVLVHAGPTPPGHILTHGEHSLGKAQAYFVWYSSRAYLIVACTGIDNILTLGPSSSCLWLKSGVGMNCGHCA